MATITVKPLATMNTAPTITGTVSFQRFDVNRNPKETIEIIVNYKSYKLFQQVGLDETVTPNVWKLQFAESLYPGTYEIDARVVDVNTNAVLASDNTNNELTILPPPINQPKMTLLQKVALVSALMGSVSKLFGGQNGIGGNPAVHPTIGDDASTSLAGRSDQERKQDPRVPNAEKRADANKNPIPPKCPMTVTAGDNTLSGEDSPDFEPGNFDQFKEQMGDTISRANEAVRDSPDEAAAMNSQQYSTSTPTTVLG
jgi:hypothetical protein